MRVRRFELRLIGSGLVVAWSVAAAAVLLAYRPGGPLDVVVGLTMLGPITIAAASVVWPPVARGSGAFPLMVCIGLGVLLVLVPSIAGVAVQLIALGSQTLMPSPEAAYPWFLALVGTALFAGFGLARRIQGGMAVRRRRLVVGIGLAAIAVAIAGGLFAAVAVANEVALQGSSVAPVASRFGPTSGSDDPPLCNAGIGVGATAKLEERLVGRADLRPIGTVDVTGERAGDDVRGTAYVATDDQLGLFGTARVGSRLWQRTPSAGWQTGDESPGDAAPADDARGDGPTLDLQVLDTALTHGNRATAEDRGIEVLEGAPARRCRIAVDGTTFRAAFPQVGWLVGEANLGHWRGQLDYWVFRDGQLGQVAATANGEAGAIDPTALQATVEVLLTATERGRPITIYPPAT